MSFEWYDEQKFWVLETQKFGSTEAIALSFVFLAYFLHPAVEAAFQRVRAYRGWRAVENRKTVEVTTYPLLAEIFCGRGRWDAARIVAVLLAAFSLMSWGLELQLELAYVKGMVIDLYLRPPPVWRIGDGNAWHVKSLESLRLNYDTMETNMSKNLSCGNAKAIYKLDNSDKIIEGVVRVASWDVNVNESPTTLSYDDDGTGIANVTSHDCTDHKQSVKLYVEQDSEPWGVVDDCSHGPGKKNGHESIAQLLKLTSCETGDVHFIVEESNTYPSFLYSVWKANNDTNSSTILEHVFHISSSARIAEALVTEIVHASKRDEGPEKPTGGGAFALLRKFSENNSTYNIDPRNRASPFGELPKDESLEDTPLSTLETLEAGIKLNTTALLCAVWLMVLALVGIAWSFLLRSRIGMDIYDRDELIRNVTLQASLDDVNHPSKMRIFVRKEDNGNLSVVVNELEELRMGCARIFGKKNQPVAIDDPVPIGAPNHASNFGGSVIVPGSRTVWLEGVRIGKQRAFPGRRGNYHYPTSVALSASPVPSHVGSIAGTPIPLIASSAINIVPLPNRLVPNSYPGLFDSTYDLDESRKAGSDIELTRTPCREEPSAEPYKKPGSLTPSPLESCQTTDVERWGLHVYSESTATVNDRPTTRLTGGSSIKPTVELPERSSQPTAGPEETKN